MTNNDIVREIAMVMEFHSGANIIELKYGHCTIQKIVDETFENVDSNFINDITKDKVADRAFDTWHDAINDCINDAMDEQAYVTYDEPRTCAIVWYELYYNNKRVAIASTNIKYSAITGRQTQTGVVVKDETVSYY